MAKKKKVSPAPAATPPAPAPVAPAQPISPALAKCRARDLGHAACPCGGPTCGDHLTH